ncbi:Putative flippase GtrA (transmembrane translocase of bactoprenol-linked glucose) [Oryzisolibacter propanilivorax]|uniref:Putative flippase GtrA (Transmembrane translocase of bactoprenol-linked glucose) n=1 Tax=Oryzisolibacter propanilivorax TaxID=1527607 RepID=A0A1G9TBW2_9BURK|nr:GtrA family protein [Oryzisolibacter propanilivorax]SDM45102.1 Putative flippase GtrA (transmembrane translocase of bactoprenol-linked glucose) [Oryzisolibacter propanilivorax]
MSGLLIRALQLLRRLPQGLQFVLVGGAAAATHLVTVALWVALTGMAPLVANVLAFFTSFFVSYAGHACLTFAGSGARGWLAAARYFLVASGSFAANEVLYALALRWLPWHYLASLLAVILLVAAGTFVLAKFWAFRAPRAA